MSLPDAEQQAQDFHAVRALDYVSSPGARRLVENRIDRSQLGLQHRRSTPNAYADANPPSSAMEPGAKPPPAANDGGGLFSPMAVAGAGVGSFVSTATGTDGGGAGQGSLSGPISPHDLRRGSIGFDIPPDSPIPFKARLVPQHEADERWDHLPDSMRAHHRKHPKKKFQQLADDDYADFADDPDNVNASGPSKNKKGKAVATGHNKSHNAGMTHMAMNARPTGPSMSGAV